MDGNEERMYHNMREMADLAIAGQVPLSRIILENEMKRFGSSEEQIYEKLSERYSVMERSAGRALNEPLPTVGGLITGVGKTQYQYAAGTRNTICGEFINLVMARALSCSEVNASMGRICAAPTAGACGIVPAVLVSYVEQNGLSREEALRGLLTASGVGAVIMKNATVAGAEGGCQAECGVAAAMAAAAVVELAGGNPDAALNAIAFSLMNCMGLVCDPVAGLVQLPCAQRNASQAVNALLSADLALAGMPSRIPADEVIEAMYRVGKQLPPQLRETALGGIAATKAGREIAKEIFGSREE